jgi:hypothetical protein
VRPTFPTQPLGRSEGGRVVGSRRLQTGDSAGNERLTATTAAVLFVLLAVEGVTVLFLRPLLSVHVFVGALLIPPVLLKLASTGYRFVRYYAGSESYRRAGPPHLLLRLLAPLLVVSTVTLFASGVALVVAGPPSGFLLGLHKVSFVAWLAVAGVHVLTYVRRVPRLALADWRRRSALRGMTVRRLLVVAALAAGLGLGVSLLPLAGPWHAWME